MSKNLCNFQVAVACAAEHSVDAAIIAQKLRLPAKNTRSMAAEESLYGQGRMAC